MAEQKGNIDSLLAMKAELEALGCKVTITAATDNDDLVVGVETPGWIALADVADKVILPLFFDLFDRIATAANDQLRKTPKTHNAATLRRIQALAWQGMDAIRQRPAPAPADEVQP